MARQARGRAQKVAFGRTPMDAANIATALLSAQMGQLQLAVAAKLAKMQAEQGASVVKLLEAAQANFNQLANVAAGIGTNLDISV